MLLTFFSDSNANKFSFAAEWFSTHHQHNIHYIKTGTVKEAEFVLLHARQTIYDGVSFWCNPYIGLKMKCYNQINTRIDTFSLCYSAMHNMAYIECVITGLMYHVKAIRKQNVKRN